MENEITDNTRNKFESEWTRNNAVYT